MDHCDQSITDVTLGNENVIFKGIKRASFSANMEGAHHFIGSSARPCIIACILVVPLSSNRKAAEGPPGEEKLPKRKGFYNLLRQRHSNHCLTIYIILNTTEGEELFKLGIGFGSRTDNHKMIIDKFQLSIKRQLLSIEKQGNCNSVPTKEAAPLATSTHKNLSKISPSGFETNRGVFLEGLSEGIVCN